LLPGSSVAQPPEQTEGWIAGTSPAMTVATELPFLSTSALSPPKADESAVPCFDKLSTGLWLPIAIRGGSERL
jgi:hypothetical protein